MENKIIFLMEFITALVNVYDFVSIVIVLSSHIWLCDNVETHITVAR